MNDNNNNHLNGSVRVHTRSNFVDDYLPTIEIVQFVMYLDKNGDGDDTVRRFERFAVSTVQLSVESENLQLDRLTIGVN